MSAVPAVQEQQGLAYRHELSVDDLISQVQKIQQIMAKVMKDGEHYGKIPGTDKPTLLKAGAEKLLFVFRLDPQYQSDDAHDGKHLTIKSICTLWHIPTGLRMGSGQGSCSTKETKYAYRIAKRKCPKCDKDTIQKSRYSPRGRPNDKPGWYCYAKIGGCGQEFDAEAPEIMGQEVGRIVNEDVADAYNTVLKMANKRSLVAAVLNVTAASDIFTQDLEDHVDDAPVAPQQQATPQQQQRGEVIDAKATRVPDEGRTYEPFGAVTMLTKMGGGTFKGTAMELYWGPGVKTKTALELFRTQDAEAYRKGYDELHDAYDAWKADQGAAQ